VTVAILGCGRIGRVHADAVRRLGGVGRLVFADADRDAAMRATQAFGGAVAYGDPGQLLGAERPAVVHVCTPPATHAALAARALEAGAHVLVEKPMALDTAEAARLGAVLRDRPGALCVDHNFLFEPEMLTARRWVQEGRIGRVFAADVFYGVDRLPGDAGPGAWAEALPGGRFTDLLPHGLYLLLHFLGDARSLAVRRGGARTDPEAPPTELRVLLDCAGGLGALHVSLASVPWELGVVVRGTAGTIRVDLAHQRALLLRPPALRDRRLAVAALGVDPALQGALGAGRRLAGKLTGRLRGYPGLRALVARFHASVREGLAPPVPFADGAAVAALLERIRRGATDAGRVVPLRQSA
jgi:predicted dehydrogenase